jgi:hypothetical protein
MHLDESPSVRFDYDKGLMEWLAGDAVLIAPVSSLNSLQTGNFTGKFAILVAQRPVLRSENAAPQ